MSTMADGQLPRAAAAAFTPELSALIDDTVYGRVWADERLSARDRSIATVAVLTALYRPDELRAHLRRAVANGVTQTELSALITHVACYAGVPGAVSASAIATEIFGIHEGSVS